MIEKRSVSDLNNSIVRLLRSFGLFVVVVDECIMTDKLSFAGLCKLTDFFDIHHYYPTIQRLD